MKNLRKLSGRDWKPPETPRNGVSSPYVPSTAAQATRRLDFAPKIPKSANLPGSLIQQPMTPLYFRFRIDSTDFVIACTRAQYQTFFSPSIEKAYGGNFSYSAQKRPSRSPKTTKNPISKSLNREIRSLKQGKERSG